MNQMNMAGFNAGGPGLGNMPMQNNGPNGAVGRMIDEHPPIEDANYEARLNTFIYGYFMTKGKYDAARALKESGMQFDPPLDGSDGGMNGAEDNMQTDSKDGIDMARPGDLPDVKSIQSDGQGGSFLLSWFALFWDVYFAQRKSSRATSNAAMYVQHTQQQARLRQDQQQHLLRGMPMGPNGVGMDYNMMRFHNGMNNENLQRRAQLNRGGLQPTPQQLAQMQTARQGLMQNHQQMRRDPSEMDMNGQRPRTPSNGDHAPSPSKRLRIDSMPFNGQGMMPNGGRGPPPGMPGQMVGGDAAATSAAAQNLLVNHGINPGNLSESQFQSFQQQNPAVQQKSIQVYAQNLRKNQRQQSMSIAGGDMTDQGSPIVASGMDLGGMGPEFYNGNNATAMQMRGGAPPNVANGGNGGNHALQDYQMQLMLLEQQNKKRLLMARQEQDTIGGGRPDGMPVGMPGPGFPPGMSPGSRGGPSPGPPGLDRKGGTPKINQVGLPGSPMPDAMRSSPAAMNFAQMNPDPYNQMNGNGMRPPSSHPGFSNGQYPPQQLEAIVRAQQGQGRMPNANGWQQGPQGQTPMIQQPQPQQPPPMGTPQQRNEMPPPQAVPNATANGRPTSPAAAAPPTPQQSSKAKPTKAAKEPSHRKKPVKKSSTNNPSVAPTPNSEADNAPPTPTPATPVTPRHVQSFAKDEQPQPNMMQGITATAPEPLAPQPDPNAMQLFDTNDYPDNMAFNNQLDNPDILENFDFEQFLQSTDDGGFSFDPAAFEGADGIEAGMGGGT